MSESYRERMRRRVKEPKIQQRLLEFGMTERELIDFIELHIEELCSESDRHCRLINEHEAVDQVIDEMSDADFDNFAKEVIHTVYSRIKKKRKRYDDDTQAEQYRDTSRIFSETPVAPTIVSPPKREGDSIKI